MFYSSVCDSLEPSTNGSIGSVASGVQHSPFLAIVLNDLARPELTVRCLLCVVTAAGIATEEGRLYRTFSAHQAIIQEAIYE